MESAETEKSEQSDSLFMTHRGGEGVETNWSAETGELEKQTSWQRKHVQLYSDPTHRFNRQNLRQLRVFNTGNLTFDD